MSQAGLFDDDAAAPAPLGPRHNIVVGTCSWTDPSLIKAGTFYPKGCNSAEQRLRYYASQFPLVEVDSSYYAMPSAQNAQLWAQRVPASFRFNVKAFRLFTGHQTPPQALPRDLLQYLPPLGPRQKNYYLRDLPAEIVDELWRRFIEALDPLRRAGLLTAVHFQFAQWVQAAPQWSEHIEQCVQRLAGHLVAVEFRNASWLGDERRARTLAWERELGVAHVVVDEPQGVGHYTQPVWELANPALAIVRLHGRNAEAWDAKGLTAASDRFNYDYPDHELADIATRARQLAERAFVVQLLVNVNYEDQGIRAAQKLERLLQEHPRPR